jgi:hypothetical protein
MKITLITLAIISALFSKQEPISYSSFSKYVASHYDFPESAKKTCEWNCIIIKVSVNSANRIIKYECLNKIAETENKKLSILLNYTFPKSDHLNHHPLIYCLSLDNSQVCDIDLPHRVYSPAAAINVYSRYISEELKKDPKANIIWGMGEKVYYPSQR